MLPILGAYPFSGKKNCPRYDSVHTSYAEACRSFKKIIFTLVPNANPCAGIHQFRTELGELNSLTSISWLFLMSSKAAKLNNDFPNKVNVRNIEFCHVRHIALYFLSKFLPNCLCLAKLSSLLYRGFLLHHKLDQANPSPS